MNLIIVVIFYSLYLHNKICTVANNRLTVAVPRIAAIGGCQFGPLTVAVPRNAAIGGCQFRPRLCDNHTSGGLPGSIFFFARFHKFWEIDL